MTLSISGSPYLDPERIIYRDGEMFMPGPHGSEFLVTLPEEIILSGLRTGQLPTYRASLAAAQAEHLANTESHPGM